MSYPHIHPASGELINPHEYYEMFHHHNVQAQPSACQHKESPCAHSAMFQHRPCASTNDDPQGTHNVHTESQHGSQHDKLRELWSIENFSQKFWRRALFRHDIS